MGTCREPNTDLRVDTASQHRKDPCERQSPILKSHNIARPSFPAFHPSLLLLLLVVVVVLPGCIDSEQQEEYKHTYLRSPHLPAGAGRQLLSLLGSADHQTPARKAARDSVRLWRKGGRRVPWFSVYILAR